MDGTVDTEPAYTKGKGDMVVWISKHALTQGVFEVDAEPLDKSPNIVTCDEPRTLFYKPEWHLTKEEAIAEADLRRQRALRQMKLDIAWLERLIGT